MKNNKGCYITLLILGGLAAACLLAVVALFIWLANKPPSDFAAKGYYVRGGRVYYQGSFPSSPFEMKKADAASFEELENGYARDKAHAYYGGGMITGADTPSFEVIDLRQHVGASYYARDKSRVYLEGVIIPKADPPSFEIVEDAPGDAWSRDKQNVYLRTEIFSDDATHFEWLEHPAGLMRDSHHIYWSAIGIVSDDPANFKLLTDPYWRDSNSVYIRGGLIAGANPATFQVLGEPYARDDRQVFYYADVIINADPETFQALEPPYARDAQRVYYMERTLPNADPQTFKIFNVNFQCTADAQHAYYQDRLIEGLDPRTFPPNGKVTNCGEKGFRFFE